MVLSMRVGAAALTSLAVMSSCVTAQGFYYQDIGQQCGSGYKFQYLGCAPATAAPFYFQPTQWFPNLNADNSMSYINYDTGGNAINITSTPYFCANTCRAHGYKYTSFFNKTCTCGSSLSYQPVSGGVVTLSPNADSDDLCNKGSDGNTYPKCGGDQRENCGSNQGARIWVDPSFPDERTLGDAASVANGYGLLGCFQGRFPSSHNEITTTSQADGPSCLKYCADLGLPLAYMVKGPPVTCQCGTEFAKDSVLVTTDISQCSTQCSNPTGNQPCSGQDCCNTGNFVYPVYANPALMGCLTPVIPGIGQSGAPVLELGTFSCYPTPSSIALRSPSVTVSYGTKTITASASFIATAKPATNTFVNYGCFWGQPLLTVLPLNTAAGLPAGSVSVTACIAACDGRGATFAALYGDTPACYCASSISLNLGPLADMERCNTPCPGDPNQNCGTDGGPLVYAKAGTPNNQWQSSWSATRSSTITYTCTGGQSPHKFYAHVPRIKKASLTL
ncbi:hypothetical protein F5Y17DRAFT_322437 [Xylariaceae sp. FL0594]|nr:hypothetical protein F5Y17DRAFT_322437 [Xylariaceae sp. FL0594]